MREFTTTKLCGPLRNHGVKPPCRGKPGSDVPVSFHPEFAELETDIPDGPADGCIEGMLPVIPAEPADFPGALQAVEEIAGEFRDQDSESDPASSFQDREQRRQSDGECNPLSDLKFHWFLSSAACRLAAIDSEKIVNPGAALLATRDERSFGVNKCRALSCVN